MERFVGVLRWKILLVSLKGLELFQDFILYLQSCVMREALEKPWLWRNRTTYFIWRLKASLSLVLLRLAKRWKQTCRERYNYLNHYETLRRWR